jgi:hypothetical protein
VELVPLVALGAAGTELAHPEKRTLSEKDEVSHVHDEKVMLEAAGAVGLRTAVLPGAGAGAW